MYVQVFQIGTIIDTVFQDLHCSYVRINQYIWDMYCTCYYTNKQESFYEYAGILESM